MAGIGVYFLLTLKKYFPEKTGKRLGICVGTFGCLLLAVFAADRADAFMYRSPQWQEYQEFNRMRSRLLDYGFPDYDTNRTLYKELGISEEALQLYKTWNFNDPEKFTAEVMEKLVEQKPERNVSGSQMLHFIKTDSRLCGTADLYIMADLWEKECSRYCFTFDRNIYFGRSLFLFIFPGQIYGEPGGCGTVVQCMSHNAVDFWGIPEKQKRNC